MSQTFPPDILDHIFSFLVSDPLPFQSRPGLFQACCWKTRFCHITIFDQTGPSTLDLNPSELLNFSRKSRILQAQPAHRCSLTRSHFVFLALLKAVMQSEVRLWFDDVVRILPRLRITLHPILIWTTNFSWRSSVARNKASPCWMSGSWRLMGRQFTFLSFSLSLASIHTQRYYPLRHSFVGKINQAALHRSKRTRSQSCSHSPTRFRHLCLFFVVQCLLKYNIIQFIRGPSPLNLSSFTFYLRPSHLEWLISVCLRIYPCQHKLVCFDSSSFLQYIELHVNVILKVSLFSQTWWRSARQGVLTITTEECEWENQLSFKLTSFSENSHQKRVFTKVLLSLGLTIP